MIANYRSGRENFENTLLNRYINPDALDPGSDLFHVILFEKYNLQSYFHFYSSSYLYLYLQNPILKNNFFRQHRQKRYLNIYLQNFIFLKMV